MLAVSDDIAEKVTDMLLDMLVQGFNKSLDYLPGIGESLEKLGQNSTKGLLHAIDYVGYQNELKNLKEAKGEISVQEMGDIRKKFGLGTQSIKIGDTDTNDFAKLLTEKGVLFCQVNIGDNDYHMFSYLDEQQSIVHDCLKIMEAQRGLVTELSPDLYFSSLAPDKVSMMSNMDTAKLELFRYFAREEELLFTVIPQEKDKYYVVFAQEDKMKAERAMLKVGWTLTGYHADENLEQLKTRIRMREELLEAVRDPSKFLNVVSRQWPENYIAIDEEGFTVFKGENAILKKPRSHEDFEEELLRQVEGISDPALFTREEFVKLDKFNRSEAKEKSKKKSMNLFHDKYDEMIEMNKLAELKNLVTSKMILNDENDSTFGIDNHSMSLSEFAQHEYIFDQDELDAKQVELDHYKSAALFRREFHDLDDVDMTDKSIDYIIAQAEMKRQARSMEAPQKEKDKEESKSAPDLDVEM